MILYMLKTLFFDFSALSGATTYNYHRLKFRVYRLS